MKNKKIKKNEKENKDIFGDQWKLAPGGRETINKCQMRVWDIQTELTAFSALFRNMGSCELDADELYGINLSLLRMGKRLAMISTKLSGTVVKEEQ